MLSRFAVSIYWSNDCSQLASRFCFLCLFCFLSLCLSFWFLFFMFSKLSSPLSLLPLSMPRKFIVEHTVLRKIPTQANVAKAHSRISSLLSVSLSHCVYRHLYDGTNERTIWVDLIDEPSSNRDWFKSIIIIHCAIESSSEASSHRRCQHLLCMSDYCLEIIIDDDDDDAWYPCAICGPNWRISEMHVHAHSHSQRHAQTNADTLVLSSLLHNLWRENEFTCSWVENVCVARIIYRNALENGISNEWQLVAEWKQYSSASVCLSEFTYSNKEKSKAGKNGASTHTKEYASMQPPSRPGRAIKSLNCRTRWTVQRQRALIFFFRPSLMN